ncbi:MAG: hypothetical protein J0I09_04535 [Sphingobacteriia bacterium]|nr:hypothetical protein [Sphingobacteriia bacterium]
MEYQYREKQRKSYTLMRSLKDATMGILITGMGIFLVWGDKFGSETIKQFLSEKDAVLKYMFGGLCLLYGVFRIYRAIKKDY